MAPAGAQAQTAKPALRSRSDGRGDHQRHDSPGHATDDRAGHDHPPRREDRGAWRRHSRSAGAQVVDAAGADVYPGFINARTQMGLNEPGPRGFEDVNEMLDLNPHAAHSSRLSHRERRDRGRADQWHHDRRRHARRRRLRRRGRGDEPRRLDVGGSDAEGERRHHVQLPDALPRRRPRWRRRTRRRRHRGFDVRRDEAHARPQARRARAAL